MKLTLEANNIESATLPSGAKVYVATSDAVEISEPPPTPVLEVYEPPHACWIAPKGASTQPGKGTPFDPVRVGNSSEYDQCFQRGKTAMMARPTEFHLYPGDYYTRGVWAYAAQQYMVLGSGEALIGAGSRRTTIHFDVENAPYETDGNPRLDNAILWAGLYYNRGLGMRVEGVCLHGHQEKLTGERLITSGVRFFGSHSTARDVGVVGMKGSPGKQIECFPISTINFDGPDYSDPTDGGDLVEDCWVRDVCPASYVSAFSLGQRQLSGNRRILPSVVQRCHVDSGHGNYFAFAFYHNTVIRDCSCRGVSQALYNDTDSVDNVLVENCDLETEYVGLSLIVSTPGAFKRNVKVRQCRFIFAPKGTHDMSLMALIDKGHHSTISHISVEDCMVSCLPSERRLSLASISSQSVALVRVRHNVIDAPACYRHLPAPTPKEALILENNHTPAGVPITTYAPLVAGS